MRIESAGSGAAHLHKRPRNLEFVQRSVGILASTNQPLLFNFEIILLSGFKNLQVFHSFMILTCAVMYSR